MAFRMAGELQTAALDSNMRKRVGDSRKLVKRRFLCRSGRERSWSEEGIGSPRWAMTLVFIVKVEDLKKFLFYCSLPAIGGETVSGGAELRASAKAFAGGVVSGPSGIRLVSPSGVLPLVRRVPPIWVAYRGRPCEQEFVGPSRNRKRNYYGMTR